MANCNECGAHMRHANPGLGDDDFWFSCPECGNMESRSKFPGDVFLGEPATPMQDPYGYDTERDYIDHGRER